MHINIIYAYYFFLITVFFITIGYFYKMFYNKRKKRQLRFKNSSYRQILTKVNRNVVTSDVDTLFEQSGVKITSKIYNRYRHYLFIILLLGVTGIFFTSPKLLNYYLVLLVLYVSSIPITEFMGKKTPFSIAIDMVKKKYNQKRDMELYRLLTQLKNIAINQPNESYSTDYIIYQLLKSAHHTNNLLSSFLMKYRTCREDEAIEYFLNRLNTVLSKDFLAILIKVDQLSPTELMNQIELVKCKKRESRITLKKKNQQSLSNWIYLPVYIPILVILLNFIMVVLWLPMMTNGFGFNN